MEGKKVSVIIPVYNVRHYLAQCIDSILSQTLNEIELICVDDGSTDGSLDILYEYAKRDNRLTVVEQKNSGAGAARNVGISFAKGEYLFFCDADDFCDEKLFASLYDAAAPVNADVVFFTRVRWSDKHQKVAEILNIPEAGLKAEQPFAPSLFQNNIISMFGPQPWNKLVRRSFVMEKGIRFQEIPRMNDVFFSAMAVTLADKIVAIPVVGYYHRIEQEGEHLQSQAGNNRTPYIAFDVYEHLRHELERRGILGKYCKSFYKAAESTFAYSLRTIDDVALLLPLFERSREFMLGGVRAQAYPKTGRFAVCGDLLSYLEVLSQTWPIKPEVLSELRRRRGPEVPPQGKLPIVMICDDAYTLPCVVALTSLCVNSRDRSRYVVYICENSLSALNIELLRSFSASPWRLDIRFISLNLEKYESIYTQYDGNTGAGSITALAKFDLPGLIGGARALYLDGDVIIKKDIADLFDVPLDGKMAAVVRDSGRLYNDTGLRAEMSAYFNSGVMLLNLDLMRKEGATQKLIDAKIALNNPKLVDQDAFNIVFDGRTKLLPIQYNALMVNLHNCRKRFTIEGINAFYGTSFKSFEDMESKVRILHFASKEKPWKFHDVRYAEEWNSYYKISPASHIPLARSNFRIDGVKPSTVPEMKNLAFCFCDFSQGGIQRVMALLLPQLVKAGYNIVLLTTNDSRNDVYELPCNVKRVVLGGGDALSERRNRIKKAIKDFSIEIVIFQEYYSTLLLGDVAAVKETGVRYVIHHHNVASNFFVRHAVGMNELEYYKCFCEASALITLSHSDEYYFRVMGCNAHYFPNPIQDVPVGFVRRKQAKMLLWMARYTVIKRPMDAIKIFEKVLINHPDATLYMLGSLEKTNFVKNIRDYVAASPKLSAAVHFEGFQSNVWKYLERATALLTTAKFEGFPCTLSEAAAAGVPTIGYEMPYLEFATNNIGFIQTPQGNISAAATAISRLFKNPDLERRASIAVRAWFDRVYGFDSVRAYKSLLSDVVLGRRIRLEGGFACEQILRTTVWHGFTGLYEVKMQAEKAKRDLRKRTAELAAEVELRKRNECSAEKYVAETSREVDRLRQEISSLHNSEAYRVGMFITWPARKIWRVVNGVWSRIRHLGKSQKTERK